MKFSCGDPHENLFVGQFRAVKLDLNLFTVQHDVPGDIEGNGILHPRFTSQLFGDQLFKPFALVVLVVAVQQVGGDPDGLCRAAGDQLLTGGGVQLDADLGPAAALGAHAVEFQEIIGDVGGHGVVDDAVPNKADQIGGSGGQRVVAGDHFVAVHGGYLPFL